MKNRRQITEILIINPLTSVNNLFRMGISSHHFHVHTAFIRKDQGTSEHMKIGQEAPNQSDNISVAAAPFPLQDPQEVC